MPDRLNLLLVEDSDSDEELLLHALRAADFEPHCRRVETEKEFVAALSPELDVILADHHLPTFGAPRALRIHAEAGLDVPFIVVSGTIGEEVAVAMIKEGATDYLLKDRLGHLGSVIRGAIAERQLTHLRRRAEAELAESEQRYRSVVELCPDVIAIHSAGKIVYMNPAANKVFGAKPGELLGRRVVDLVHPDSRRDALFDITTELTEAQLLRVDGSVVEAEVATAPIVHQGAPAILAVIRDVTARRQAEIRYRELFDRVPVGLYRTARDGTVIAANAAMAEMLGHSGPDALIGIQAGEELYATRQEREVWIARVLAEGAVDAHPMRLRRRDGNELWVENSVRTVRDDHGVVTHFDGSVEDISARRQAQQALEERAQLAQFAAETAIALTEIDSLPDMLRRCAQIMVDRLGAAFARFWTLNEPENVLELRASAGMYTHIDGPHGRVPVGQFKIGLIASERLPHLTNAVVGDPRVSDQAWAAREGMVAFAGHPLEVEDRLVGVMAMFARRPLSLAVLDALSSVGKGIALAVENRLATAALRTALDRAEAADKLKSRFLANISHEIRTPLNVILGFSSLIADEVTDRKDQSITVAVDAIHRAGHRLIQTVQGVLDLARLETGEFKVSVDWVDVGAVAESCSRKFRDAAARKGIALACEIGSPGTRARIDEYCLRNSLERLLDNAVKFTDRGKVRVRTFPDDGRLCLSVEDTGTGISPAFLPNVFQPFSQEDSSPTRRFEGAGIGLALAKRYLEANGAEISVRSEKGVGTTVTLRLPTGADTPPT